jgi:hypothetical protein
MNMQFDQHPHFKCTCRAVFNGRSRPQHLCLTDDAGNSWLCVATEMLTAGSSTSSKLLARKEHTDLIIHRELLVRQSALIAGHTEYYTTPLVL